MWVRGKASLCFLTLFSSLYGRSEEQVWKFPQVSTLSVYTFVYGVSCVFFFFLLTSQTFCHHLILKLERKGMEERIANMRGFWKFPFYGTRVFLKNSSLSVVLCDFGENHLPSPTSVLFKSDLMPALFSLFSSALFRIRG